MDSTQHSLVCLLMLASIALCTNSFLVAGIFNKNHSDKSFHYSPGLMERAEAFIFFILMMALPAQFNLLGYLFVLLVTLTACLRLLEMYQMHR